MSMCRAGALWLGWIMQDSARQNRRQCRSSLTVSVRAVGSVPVLDSWRDGGDKTNSASDKECQRDVTGDGPLDGMRIVSFDHVLAGPYGTTILAELGADVIKVESSKGGMDPFRFFGVGGDPNVSARFLEFNRNKRSFTVNLKHPNGQKILHDLVAKVDAVLDNFSVDVVGRIGLAYDQLCKVKSDIVNLRMPGLGTTGPKRHFSTLGREYRVVHRAHSYVESSGQYQPARRLADGVARLCFRRSVCDPDYFRCAQSRSSKKGAFIDLAQSEATAFMIGANFDGGYGER